MLLVCVDTGATNSSTKLINQTHQREGCGMQSTGLTEGSGGTAPTGGDVAPDIWRVIDSVTAEERPDDVRDTGSRPTKKWWRRQS
jgi:hypothetical protein